MLLTPITLQAQVQSSFCYRAWRVIGARSDQAATVQSVSSVMNPWVLDAEYRGRRGLGAQ